MCEGDWEMMSDHSQMAEIVEDIVILGMRFGTASRGAYCFRFSFMNLYTAPYVARNESVIYTYKV
jgi:hypothetical protein